MGNNILLSQFWMGVCFITANDNPYVSALAFFFAGTWAIVGILDSPTTPPKETPHE